MKQRKHHSFISVLTALAIFVGACCCVPGFVDEASAITQAEINAMQNRLNQMSQQMKKLEGQLKEIAKDKDQALQQKYLLDDQIDLMEQTIKETSAAIAGYDELIAVKEAEIAEIEDEIAVLESEIADTEKKERAQYDLFCRQVRSMEEQGSLSYFAILFDAADFSDLLDRAMMISEIMDYHNGVINMLLETRDALNTSKDERDAVKDTLDAAKNELEGERTDQEILRSQQESDKKALEERREEANALVQEIKAQEKEYAVALEQAEKEEERIQAEIVRMTEELKAQNVKAEGGYIWPVKSRRITSPFGPRNTGIPGASTNHKGVDIGSVGYTSEVYAAKSGKVIISTRVSSYGNYVSIAHSDGTSTLYAHMSSRKVSVGQTVKQGDVIGITGSTGISSGPHLHFEITEKGARVDPLKYLKGYVKGW